MAHSFILSFTKNVSIIEQVPDCRIVQSSIVTLNIPDNTLNLEDISPGFLAALRILAGDGATEEHLSNLVLQTDGLSKLPNFYYYLQKFIGLGMICHTVLCEGIPLATRVPISPYDKFQTKKDAALEQKYVLSRFAYCHKDKDHFILESPLSHAQIILADWRGAALIAEIAKPQDSRELSTKIPSISQEVIQRFFSLLLSTEMLWEFKEDGKTQEEENETLVQWEFHDLMFHSRTRIGRHSNNFGKTYRFLEKIKPLPVVKFQVSSDTIELYKPDIQKLQDEDKPFTLVLEERMSVRKYNDKPITDKQLGEFLYRSARVKRIFAKNYGECSNRPYPSGGACYELELYIIINTCENIPSGLYHYCPQEHQLCRISGRNSYVEALLKDGRLANGERCIPQVLIIFAARFQRVAWNYESIAYAIILKNVGSLQQTMYLVATAMGLAPCALGSGNSDLFAASVGTDYYAESSVGELILGSNPTK